LMPHLALEPAACLPTSAQQLVLRRASTIE
jgi:hypothetical protein